jgi:hypothetical protein
MEDRYCAKTSDQGQGNSENPLGDQVSSLNPTLLSVSPLGIFFINDIVFKCYDHFRYKDGADALTL